jgi:hypothetical protein
MSYFRLLTTVLGLFLLTGVFCWLLSFLGSFSPILTFVVFLLGFLVIGLGGFAAIDNM